MKKAQEKLKTTQSRQKNHHNKQTEDVKFDAREHVFLRATPTKGVSESFESEEVDAQIQWIFMQCWERVGRVAYRFDHRDWSIYTMFATCRNFEGMIVT